MPPEFKELVRRGVRVAGTNRALGKAIGISENKISDVLHERGYPFNALNCIRLARLLGERDWVVLRAAGKGALADLLEQAYGHRRIRVSPPHDPFAGLSTAQRARLETIARELRAQNKK